MKLNNKQKQFLFDNYYVDAKVLDALTYKGWQNYFIKNFTWKLDTDLNHWNMRTLQLVDKKQSDYVPYSVDLNFQGDDFNKLKNL